MAVPRLLAISDRRRLPEGGFDDWLAAVGRSPIDAVQIREKDLDPPRLLALVERARATLPVRIQVLVNRRADVALAARAEGVHLTSDSLPAAELRRRFGARLVIGVSTHSLDEVTAAREAGADYVTFGPVWSTPSKEAYGPPAGLPALRRAAAIGIPVLALGGVTISRAPEAAAAGAAGIAAIRLFARPGDPRLATLGGLFAAADSAPRRAPNQPETT